MSSDEGFRYLRQLVQKGGITALCREGCHLPTTEIHADRDGIRCFLLLPSSRIKFEIVKESRISLETPASDWHVCGISCLSEADLITEKLLANADRWNDSSVYGRDVIDLAAISPNPRLKRQAMLKALTATGSGYAQAVPDALEKAIEHMNRHWLEECMAMLKMNIGPPPPQLPIVWRQRLENLRSGWQARTPK